MKEEKAFSLHSASWSEAVLTCRLLWVSFRFPSLSQLGRRGETQLSRILSAALLWRWFQWWSLSVYLINSRTLSSFQKPMTQRSIWGGRSCRWGEWKIMGMNCFYTLECLLDGRQETLQLCFASYFCFCLEIYSQRKYTLIWRQKLLPYCLGFIMFTWASLGSSNVKESACNVGDLSLIPGSGWSPGEGNGNALQYSCGESHGQRSLMVYSPCGHKELAMTE